MNETTAPRRLKDVSLAVEPERIELYARITDDFNPIHVDPDFAATTPMGGVIAHGTMSLALLWQSLADSFAAPRLGRANLDIRFTRPVRIGDRVTAGGEADPEVAGRYRVWVRNQTGEAVIEGWAEL